MRDSRLWAPGFGHGIVVCALSGLLMPAAATSAAGAERPAPSAQRLAPSAQIQVTPPPPDDLSRVPRITMQELKKLLAGDGVIVIDVRSLEGYRDGHIPGARLVPIEDVEARAGEFKNAKKPIVTYCS